MSERAGRYQRSARGLIGAMVATLLAVGVLVAVRALGRGDLEVRPEPVDYRALAASLQRQGLDVVYPGTLPEGWRATSAAFDPGERPGWGVGLLTDEDRFVGMRQQDLPLADLLRTYVDETTTERPAVTVAGSVAGRWRVFADAGGDVAYAADVGEATVLVFGSAGGAEVRRLVATLTDAPLPSAA